MRLSVSAGKVAAFSNRLIRWLIFGSRTDADIDFSSLELCLHISSTSWALNQLLCSHTISIVSLELRNEDCSRQIHPLLHEVAATGTESVRDASRLGEPC